MQYEQMEQHVGHELTVGIVHEPHGGPPIGLTLDCHRCNVTLEEQRKPDAVGKFKKVDGVWGIKVEDGPKLEVGSIVTVEKKNKEVKKIVIGEVIAEIDGAYPGIVYANEGEVK